MDLTEHKSVTLRSNDNSLTIVSVMASIDKLAKTSSRVIAFASRAPDDEDNELTKAINRGLPFNRTMERPDFSLAYALVTQDKFKRLVVALPLENLRVLFAAAVIANAEQAGLEPVSQNNNKSRGVRIKGKCRIHICSNLIEHQPKDSMTVRVTITDRGSYLYQFRMH